MVNLKNFFGKVNTSWLTDTFLAVAAAAAVLFSIFWTGAPDRSYDGHQGHQGHGVSGNPVTTVTTLTDEEASGKEAAWKDYTEFLKIACLVEAGETEVVFNDEVLDAEQALANLEEAAERFNSYPYEQGQPLPYDAEDDGSSLPCITVQ